MDVIAVYIFFSFDSNSRISRTIVWAGDGPWSHTGLIFVMRDGSVVYLEALLNRGVTESPIESLRGFAEGAGHHVFCDRLYIENPGVLYADCRRDVGTLSYANWQLVAMALSERYGVPLRDSKRKVVCSEWVTRHLIKHGYDLRDSRRNTPDMVTPCSAWRRWLEIKTGLNATGIPPYRFSKIDNYTCKIINPPA